MSGKPSAIGFGFQPFGDHPFGSADWAEEVTWGVLPAFYREDDALCDFTPPEPLRKYIDSIKPTIQEIKDRFEQFPDLWDANRVPLAQLANLGYNFNVLVESLKTFEDQLVYTVGAENAALDLSTLSIVPPAEIVPSTFVLKVTYVETGRVYRIKDDGEGTLVEPTVLPSGGTIDYATGDLTGLTETLTCETEVLASFLSSSKDEALQRSEVLNAIQFFLNKGIDQGYAIAAALNGLLVTITPLWAVSCDPGALLQEEGPTSFFPRFDAFPADEIALDSVFDDFYATWPRRLDWDDPCRSAQLRLEFYPPDDADDAFFDNYSATVESVVTDLTRVTPIHVRFNEIRALGPSAVAGGWTIPVVAENSAVAGGWTIPVTAELSAAAGGWTIPVNATPTP